MFLLLLSAACQPDTPPGKQPCDETPWYADADGDGYGAAAVSTVACEAPAAHVADATDCDDADATRSPGAPERLDGADDDCDTEVDEVAAPWETDLVANGGFEAGDLSGWTLESGPCEVVTGLEWIVPYEGTFMLHGGQGGTGDCLVSQSFDLVALGLAPEDLDSGRAGVDAMGVLANEVDAAAAGWFTTYDRALLRVRYLDADGGELGSIRTLLSEAEAWAGRGTGGTLPVGTRKLVLEVQGKLREGLEVDSVADTVSLSMTTETPFSPTITLLPFLQDFRQDAMRLLWETDGNLCAHVVEWGPTGAPLTNVVTVVDTVEIDAAHFVHSATIEGLSAGTRYDYRVRSGDTWSDTYTFRTAPTAGEAFAVGWTGDNQNGPETFTGHLEGMVARGADLFMSPGDIVHNWTWTGSSVENWHEEWFTPLEASGFSATRPVLFARGNHDNHYSLAYAYSALPENEDWYSFSYGNVFFVVLDSNSHTDSEATVLSQKEYLAAALASDAAIAADFRVVTFHNPPYTNSRHDYSQVGFTNAQEDWVPLLEGGGVDLVVGGHFHAYQRGAQNGVTYVVVGGGGAGLDTYVVDLYDFFEVVEQVHHYAMMEVDGKTLTWTVYDTNAAELDSFTLHAD
ncbi:MAG: metallophosphoesterase [Myxococcota bacterium]